MSFYEITPTPTVEFLPVPPNGAFFVLASSLVGGQSVAPSVSYVTAPGAIDPTDPIVVDVLDVDSPAPSTFLFVRFAASGGVEVVWDGAAFAPFYGTSTRVAITSGHRYTLRRSGGGWISGGLTINANAIDDTGAVAT